MNKLTTARLIIRPYSVKDLDAVQAYCSVPSNVTYMTFGPNTLEDTRAFLEQCEQHWRQKPLKDYEFAIILKETGGVIGGCGLMLNDELSEGMLGWILHQDYHRRGYMTEAAGAVMRFGFESLRLHRQYATCFADNLPSYKTMEKLGMRREGHFVKCRLLRNSTHDDWRDEYHYAILRDEWQEKAGR